MISDEQRRSGLFYHIRKLNELLGQWRRDQKAKEAFVELQDLVEKTYPALFVNLGYEYSDSTTRVFPTAPWQMAVMEHLTNPARRILNAEDSSFQILESTDLHNYVDLLKNRFEISNLLGCCGFDDLAYVFKVYGFVEDALGSLRRYSRDEFCRSYPELNDILGKIFGRCFEIFSDYPIYAKACVLRETMKLIANDYGFPSDSNDELAKILAKTAHLLGKAMAHDIDTLTECHVALMKAKTLNSDFNKTRLMCFVKLGAEFISEKDFQELIGDLEKTPLKNCATEVQALYKKHKGGTNVQTTDDEISNGIEAYGFEGYSFMSRWDRLKNGNTVQSKRRTKRNCSKKR